MPCEVQVDKWWIQTGNRVHTDRCDDAVHANRFQLLENVAGKVEERVDAHGNVFGDHEGAQSDAPVDAVVVREHGHSAERCHPGQVDDQAVELSVGVIAASHGGVCVRFAWFG